MPALDRHVRVLEETSEGNRTLELFEALTIYSWYLPNASHTHQGPDLPRPGPAAGHEEGGQANQAKNEEELANERDAKRAKKDEHSLKAAMAMFG